MANLEILALDTAVPQIRAPGAGDGYSVPRDMTFAASTTLNAQTINAATLTASAPVFTDASKNLTSSGTVGVVNGGTGATTASTARSNLGLAIGTDIPSPTGTGASGTWGISISGNAATATNGVVTTGSYADPTWITSLAGSKITGNISGNAANVTGIVAVANGGTGLSTYTAGDLVYYATGTALTKLGIGASGRYLSSSGTAPQWSAPAALTKVDDTNVTLTLGGSASTALLNAASLTLGWTGQLSVARGGTGASSFTANQVIYGSFSQSANLTFDGTTLFANQIGGGAF